MSEAFGYKYPRKELRIALTEFAGREAANEEQSRTTLTSSRFEHWWVVEFTAWAVSLAAFFIIVGLLIVHDDIALPTSIIPEWQPVIGRRRMHIQINLSLNSILAIFSTIFKTCLAIPLVTGMSQLKWTWYSDTHPLSDFQLIDHAKDNPANALVLLWKFRGRRLVCLGAVVVAASFGLDFVFQTVVNYPLQSQRIMDATTPRAIGYSSVNIGYRGENTVIVATMLSAIETGFYDVDGNMNLAPKCVNGQCQWDDFTSLGVCSGCEDATDRLQKSCSEYNISNEGDTDSTSVAYCNYTLPNGLQLSGGGESFYNNGSYNDVYSLNMSGISTGADAQDPAWISTLTMIQGQWSDSMQLTANATRCRLSLCVKKISATVKNGVYQESVISTFENSTSDAKGVTFRPPTSFSKSRSGGQESLIVANDSVQALRKQFSVWWTGNWTSNNNMNAAQNGGSNVASRIQSLGGYKGVQSLMANLATSMTTVIRTTGDVNHINDASGEPTAAIGQAVEYVPMIAVRWYWLVLPALLLLLTLIFLIATAYVSKSSRGTLWKNSSLAPFVHPLTNSVRKELDPAKTVRQLDKIAERTDTQWKETEKGWRFVKPSRACEDYNEIDYGSNVRHRERLAE